MGFGAKVRLNGRICNQKESKRIHNRIAILAPPHNHPVCEGKVHLGRDTKGETRPL